MSAEFKLNLTAGSVKKAMSAAGATSRDLWYVPVENIRVIKGFNVRVKDAEYKAHIRAIADSIKANGYFPSKPLEGFVVTEGGQDFVEITDGHCRLEGAILAISEGAPLKQLPVVTRDRTTSMEDLTVSLVVSNAGKPLTPYELAVVCKRLTSFGWSPKEIAEKLIFTRTYVDQLLSLMAAPAAVQELVKDGKVAASTAIDMVKKHGEKAAEVIEKAVAGTPGKDKVTKKHLEPVADAFAKKLRREAREMYTVIRDIYEECDKLPKKHKDAIIAILDKVGNEK